MSTNDLKIGELPQTTTLQDGDLFVLESGGVAFRATFDKLADAILDKKEEETGGSEYDLGIPALYKGLVDVARDYYTGEFAHVMIMLWQGATDATAAAVFLMDNFEILSYDPVTSEFTAIGWYSVYQNQSTGAWEVADHRYTASTGGNYLSNVKFASRFIKYNGETLWPVSVLEEIKTNSVAYDDTADKITLTMATGYVETLTFAFDESGNPVSYTDSSGHVTTLEGVSLSV